MKPTIEGDTIVRWVFVREPTDEHYQIDFNVPFRRFFGWKSNADGRTRLRSDEVEELVMIMDLKLSDGSQPAGVF